MTTNAANNTPDPEATAARISEEMAFIAANPNFVPAVDPTTDESVLTDVDQEETSATDHTTSNTSSLQIDLEGLKSLQASLILTTMEALQKKKSKRLEPHLEESLIKSLGTFPASGKGIEVIKWVVKMDTLCNTYMKDIEPKETLKIIFHTILDPDTTNQLNLAFNCELLGTEFIRPSLWRDDWKFPLTGNEERIHIWVARFLLAQSCPREVMVNFARNLAPTRQMENEGYTRLVQRIQALKSM